MKRQSADHATILMAAYTNYRRDPRVRREAEALVEAGHRVVFLASRQPGEAHRENISGVEVIKVFGLRNRKTSIAMYMLDYVLFALMIFGHLLVHPRRYQLIHVNNMPDFLVFATLLSRVTGTPVIHDVHDLMPELFQEKFRSGERHWIVGALKAQERWAGRFASVVLTVEERLKDILSTRGIPRSKIHVLMNLPDERIFTTRPNAPARPSHAPFVLVYHGTLARRLGLDVALEAAARAVRRIPSLQLRIIGAGEERQRLIALSERLGLGSVVSFSDGFVPVQDIPALIRDADVGLVPLRISEGTDIMLPTKLLEYVAMGIPCVVPRTGTIVRYFDEEMVQFFDAGSPDSLSEAIVALYSDPARRRALAEASIRRFGALYRWSTHKQVYTDLVMRMLRQA